MAISETLTSYELEAVEKLKKKFEEELNSELKNDDYLFLRFLRARNWNMNLAEDMLRKHIIWRRKNDIDNILKDYKPNEIIKEYLALTRIGFDKEGSPLRYFDFGRTDCKGILKAAKKNEVCKTIITYFEEDVKVMKEQSSKLGKEIQQWTYIFNFDGYTFAKATHKTALDLLTSVFSIYEANYPERLKKCFAINSTVYFNIAFSFVKPFLSGETIRKISIYGKDEYKDDLLNLIDPEVLPAFLGGNRTDPDGNPFCYSIIIFGKDIPEELYLTKSENRLSSTPNAKKLIVSRMSKIQVPIQVNDPESTLEWEFETESRDIGFGLFYKSNTSELIELVPKQRIDAHLLSEAGMYRCTKPGTYFLMFDNTYSWIHRKEVYYKVSVIKPNGEPC